MANPQTLTGGQTGFGTASNNTGTDAFIVSKNGNTVYSLFGNLQVTGFELPDGTYDNNTVVHITDAVGVLDTIILDGGNNVVASDGHALTGSSTVSVTVGHDGNLFQADSGHNFVQLKNAGGTTNVSLSGGGNTVLLNGDAANTVTMTGAVILGNPVPVGGSVIGIGTFDDDLFGYKAKVVLSDSNNAVYGGDEDFTVSGGSNNNSVLLGDGTNTVTLTGTGNNIYVGGGNNTVTAGSGHDVVKILGVDGFGEATANPDDGPVPMNPTDTVNLAGGTNVVYATYENVIVNGAGTTGGSTILLGNGKNTVNMGGNANAIYVGNSLNSINTTGNGNVIVVTDPTGVGTDAVSLGSGTGNVVYLASAGGTVSGNASSGPTINEIVQNPGATANVTVNLDGGTGLILLGDGMDSVTANGDGSHIALGNGVDTVVANGNGTTVAAGNGAGDKVTATGNNAIVGLGNGNGDTVVAGGANAVIVVGNGNGDSVTANGAGTVVSAGNGNNDIVVANGAGSQVYIGSGTGDQVIATGTGSTVVVSATSSSTDTITVGGSALVAVNGGTSQISGTNGDLFYLNGLKAGSNILETGSNNKTFLGTDSSAKVTLDPAQTGNVLYVQADTAAGAGSGQGVYAGKIEIQGFTSNSVIDLQSLMGGIDGNLINSYAEVQANLQTNFTNQTLLLKGGGSIQFDTIVPFQPSEFAYSANFGPVHP